MLPSTTYPARLTPAAESAPGETGFIVTFPDLPEAITQGETLAEALMEAGDCLEEAITHRARRGHDLPPASAIGDGLHPITLSATAAAKAGLARAMHARGMSNCDLAAALGQDEKQVRRLLDPRHQLKLASLERASRVLGLRVRVFVEDAA